MDVKKAAKEFVKWTKERNMSHPTYRDIRGWFNQNYPDETMTQDVRRAFLDEWYGSGDSSDENAMNTVGRKRIKAATDFKPGDYVRYKGKMWEVSPSGSDKPLIDYSGRIALTDLKDSTLGENAPVEKVRHASQEDIDALKRYTESKKTARKRVEAVDFDGDLPEGTNAIDTVIGTIIEKLTPKFETGTVSMSDIKKAVDESIDDFDLKELLTDRNKSVVEAFIEYTGKYISEEYADKMTYNQIITDGAQVIKDYWKKRLPEDMAKYIKSGGISVTASMRKRAALVEGNGYMVSDKNGLEFKLYEEGEDDVWEWEGNENDNVFLLLLWRIGQSDFAKEFVEKVNGNPKMAEHFQDMYLAALDNEEELLAVKYGLTGDHENWMEDPSQSPDEVVAAMEEETEEFEYEFPDTWQEFVRKSEMGMSANAALVMMDKIMDEITFDDLITTIEANEPEVTESVVRRVFGEIKNTVIQNARETLREKMPEIMDYFNKQKKLEEK